MAKKRTAGELGSGDLGHVVAVRVNANTLVEAELLSVEHTFEVYGENHVTLRFAMVRPEGAWEGWILPASTPVEVGDWAEHEVPF